MSRIRALVIVAAVAALSATSPLAAQVTVRPGEAVADRLLAAQNAERFRLGLKPLVWSARLADHAKKWAQTLATSDMFEHAPVGADGGEGENLWYGTKDDYELEEMIGFFLSESKQFKRGIFPDVSTTGDWEAVGHYTQIVWKDTREVGCTVASNQRRDFLVCRYWPAGNVIGQPVFDYNRPVARYLAVPAVKPGAAKPDAGGPPTVSSSNVSQSGPKKRASRKRRRGD